MKRLLATLIPLALVSACSHTESAGATSETTNGIALSVFDDNQKPVALARLSFYDHDGNTLLLSAESDSNGFVRVDDQKVSEANGVYAEGIFGQDSALMSWEKLNVENEDSTVKMTLLPSAKLNVRSGVANGDTALLFDQIHLENTPYSALRLGGDYNFGRVPQGVFNIVSKDSALATVELSAGQYLDRLISFGNLTKEFVLEDFDDGDSLTNLAKDYPNYGWYLVSSKGAAWINPDSSRNFKKALTSQDAYQGLSFKGEFDLGDSGMVQMGVHLGDDTTSFDLRKLTAIRMKIKGNSEIGVALEHYKKDGDGNYHKAFWRAEATDEWTEVVFRPGEEILDSVSNQVELDEIWCEMGILSIFVYKGTTLSIDEIVFEGVDVIKPKAK